MKRLTILFFVVFIGLSNVNAQQDFRLGYIITSDNDTLSGKVLFRQSESNFEECFYAKSDGEQPVSYTPSQIKGYSVNGDVYFSREASRLGIGTKQIFAKVLLLGKVNLFSAFDEFFIEKDGVMKELNERKTPVVQNGVTFMRTDKDYLPVLNEVLTDCPPAQSKIPKTLFNEPSIKKLIKLYNNCFQGSKEVTGPISKRDKKFHAMLGITGGHTSVSLRNVGGMFAGIPVNSEQFGSDNNYYPGFSVEVNTPFATENLAVHLDFFFQKNSLESVYIDTQNNQSTAVSWKFETLNIPVGITYYCLNLKKMRAFIDGGVSFYSRKNSNFQGLLSDPSGVYPINATTVKGEKTSSTLYFAGLGVAYSPLPSIMVTLRGRYEFGEFKVTENEVYRADNFIQTFSVFYKF